MEWIHSVWANGYGYLVLLVALMIVNLLPPIPAETLIPFSATLFADQAFSMPLAIAMGTGGLVLGTLPLYYLGRVLGEQRCKTFLERHRRWLVVTPGDIDRSGRWFRRYGGVLVMFGRLVPGMRSMVSIPAGFHHMRLAPFMLWSMLGSALWASVLLSAGHWLSHALPGLTALRLLAVMLAVFGAFYVYRVIRD